MFGNFLLKSAKTRGHKGEDTTVLPPFFTIVQDPGRSVILGMEIMVRKAIIFLHRGNGRGGFGSQTAADPFW